VLGPGAVLVAPTAKQSDALGQATDSSEALDGPGGFFAAQLTPFQLQACGRAGRCLLSRRNPTISQREFELHEMPFDLANGPGPDA
jgi:hypothetical protein